MAIFIADPWAKLAADFHIVGVQQALDKLVEQHPKARSVLRDLPVKP